MPKVKRWKSLLTPTNEDILKYRFNSMLLNGIRYKDSVWLSGRCLIGKVHLRLLSFLEDLDVCGAISRDSAVLACLYRALYKISHGDKASPWLLDTPTDKILTQSDSIYVHTLTECCLFWIIFVFTFCQQLWSLREIVCRPTDSQTNCATGWSAHYRCM